MPDVVNSGVAPAADVLNAPNRVYQKPENPLAALADKVVTAESIGAAPAQPQPQRLQWQNRSVSPQEPSDDQGDGDVPIGQNNGSEWQQKPVGGNPYPRLRVVTRERDRERKENEALREQIGVLMKAVEKAGILDEEDDDEEEIPGDPLSQLSRGQEKLLEKVEEIEQNAVKNEQKRQEIAVNDAANQQIKAFAAKLDQVKPGLYQEACAHVVNVWMSEELEDDDSISEAEAQQKVVARIDAIKKRAVRNGQNPGEEFLKRASLLGWTYDGPAPQPQQGAAKPKPDARAAVAQERERANALSSISSVSGSPAKDPMLSLKGMSEKDKIRAIQSRLRETGNMRRGLSLKDMGLEHKIKY